MICVKKILSVCLTVCLLLGLFTFGAAHVSAANGTIGSCTWTLDGTVLTISGNGVMGNSQSQPWGKGITQVIINEGVTEIGDFAFHQCTTLTDIHIASSVRKIGNGAFYNCRSLRRVNLPKYITVIPEGTFAGCNSLAAIDVDADNTAFSSSDGVLFNKDKTELLKYPSGKLTSSYAVPSGVKKIGMDAFSNSGALRSVTLPATITEIGLNAFNGTTIVTNKSNYDNGVLYIGNYLIKALPTITSCVVKDGITVIADGAFTNCEDLESISLPNGLTHIGDYAFSWCSSLDKISLPITLKHIEPCAFSDCKELSHVWYAGKLSDKNGLGISAGNERLNNAIWYYNACRMSDMHTWTDVTYVKPTCTTQGSDMRTCEICGVVISEITPTAAHAFTKWEQTKAPTCTVQGEEKRECTNCDHYETRSVATVAHKMGEKRVVKESTCDTKGKAVATCSVCKKEDTEEIAVLGHDFRDAGITKQPTISSPGIKESKCSRCAKSQKEYLLCSATDEKTGVGLETTEGVFKEGTTFSVEPIKGEEEENIRSALEGISNTFKAYKISAELGGASVQPNGRVTLAFNIPENFSDKVVLYSISEGVAQKLNAVVYENNNTIVAEVSSFGNIAVCDRAKWVTSGGVSETIDELASLWWVWTVLGAVLAVIAFTITLIIIKKKKAKA